MVLLANSSQAPQPSASVLKGVGPGGTATRLTNVTFADAGGQDPGKTPAADEDGTTPLPQVRTRRCCAP